MKRRSFLGAIAGLSVFPFIAKYSAVNTEKNGKPPLDSFSSFLDTLIPEDETPSASALGVGADIVNLAKSITNYTKLLELGCQWLDANAQSLGFDDFTALPQVAKDSVVAKAERASETDIGKIFFDRVYADALRFYYSNPDSWTSLGISSPPQPIGYPDYDKPPLHS